MSALTTTEHAYTAEVLQTVRRKDEMFSLTDFWKLAGSLDKKSPSDWQNREATTELIDTLCQILNTPKIGVLKSARGRTTGGTWAHKSLALAYAKWLDPKLHLLVNQVFFERIEEEAVPELAIQRGNDRARKTWLKQGKTEKWIQERTKSVAARNEFTHTLATHGVKNDGFKNCTNATYNHLFGGTADVVRHKKGLPEKTNVRDHMDEIQLAAVRLSELIAAEKIEGQNLQGNAQCEMACTGAAKGVALAINQARKN